MEGGLDSWSELSRFQELDIFDQVVIVLWLDSLLEKGEHLVNLLYHLAGQLNFKLLVEVRDVLSENIFKSNELLHLKILPLEVHVGVESPVSPLLMLREQPFFQCKEGRSGSQGLIVTLKDLPKSAISRSQYDLKGLFYLFREGLVWLAYASQII